MKLNILFIGSALLCGLFAAELPYPENKVLALQICLDRRGFSSNTLDGQFGKKTIVAMATYCAVKGIPCPYLGIKDRAVDILFPGERDLFTTVIVSQADHDALVAIPKAPEGKAALAAMGYQTIQEMFAERGHLSETCLRKLNRHARWPNPPVGTVLQIPFFPLPPKKRGEPPILADVLRVSLSRLEITAFDKNGQMIALLPCSIAAEKAKRPPAGELQVATLIPKPNYTYTPDHAVGRVKKLIFPPGPNNPVGSAWIGLTLPTYGIHGTPYPEQIGRAESHGCFRLANWNAVRLRELCDIGTSVVVEQ